MELTIATEATGGAGGGRIRIRRERVTAFRLPVYYFANCAIMRLYPAILEVSYVLCRD